MILTLLFKCCTFMNEIITLWMVGCLVLTVIKGDFQRLYYPVDWDCRIQLLLCRGVRPPPHNECPRYDTKQSDGEVLVMLELWGMGSTPSLPSLPGPFWPRVVAPDRILSLGQIVLMPDWIVKNRTVLTFNCLKTKTILILNWIV